MRLIGETGRKLGLIAEFSGPFAQYGQQIYGGMKTYITPLLPPALASAFGPLARCGSRTSTHSAVRASQPADS